VKKFISYLRRGWFSLSFITVIILLAITHIQHGVGSGSWLYLMMGAAGIFVIGLIIVIADTISKWWAKIQDKKGGTNKSGEQAGREDSSKDKKFQKLKEIGFWELLVKILSILLAAWLIYGMISCARSCCAPKVQVLQTEEQASLGEWKFHWKYPVTGKLGSFKKIESGRETAFIQVNDSNEWKIVLSDNQGRMGKIEWKKKEPFGHWSQETPPESGKIWWTRVSNRELRGWMTIAEENDKRLFISFQR